MTRCGCVRAETESYPTFSALYALPVCSPVEQGGFKMTTAPLDATLKLRASSGKADCEHHPLGIRSASDREQDAKAATGAIGKERGLRPRIRKMDI